MPAHEGLEPHGRDPDLVVATSLARRDLAQERAPMGVVVTDPEGELAGLIRDPDLLEDVAPLGDLGREAVAQRRASERVRLHADDPLGLGEVIGAVRAVADADVENELHHGVVPTARPALPSAQLTPKRRNCCGAALGDLRCAQGTCLRYFPEFSRCTTAV